jgi:hypothetical protein
MSTATQPVFPLHVDRDPTIEISSLLLPIIVGSLSFLTTFPLRDLFEALCMYFIPVSYQQTIGVLFFKAVLMICFSILVTHAVWYAMKCK